jgi:hypothetical protein
MYLLLRHNICPSIPPATIGDAERICYAYNLQIIFCNFFLVLCASTNGTGGMCAPIVLAHYKRGKSVPGALHNDSEMAY